MRTLIRLFSQRAQTIRNKEKSKCRQIENNKFIPQTFCNIPNYRWKINITKFKTQNDQANIKKTCFHVIHIMSKDIVKFNCRFMKQ